MRQRNTFIRPRGTLLIAGVALAAGLWAAPAASAVPTRSAAPPTSTCSGQWRDIAGLGGTATWPLGLNERGDVVGLSEIADGTLHPFRWRDGVMTDLSRLGLSTATLINDRGDIATSTLAGDGIHEHAALWRNNKIIDLGTLGGPWSNIRGMNQRGDIIGVSATAEFAEYGTGFLWRNGTMVELPGYGARAIPISINEHGDVVGDLERPDGTSAGAALWRQGRLTRVLPSFGDPQTAVALRINDRGQILGAVSVPETGTQNGFLWYGGHVSDLGPATVWDINDRGEVALIHLDEWSSWAARWYRGTLTALPQLAPTSSAYAINNRGEILGLTGGHGVVWNADNEIIDLGELAGMPTMINDHGLAVGYAWSNGLTHMVVADLRCR